MNDKYSWGTLLDSEVNSFLSELVSLDEGNSGSTVSDMLHRYNFHQLLFYMLANARLVMYQIRRRCWRMVTARHPPMLQRVSR